MKNSCIQLKVLCLLQSSGIYLGLFTRQMFETILMMRRNFTLEFLKYLLRSISEITRNNLLKKYRNSTELPMAIKRCKYSSHSYVGSSRKGVL